MKIRSKVSENVQELSSAVIDVGLVIKNWRFEFYREGSVNGNERLMNFYQECDSDFVSVNIIRECLVHA